MTTGDPILTARRISVVGSSGSGKTWLARDLSGRLGLPHVELDVLRLQVQLRNGNAGDFRQSVAQQVAGQAWVIDGHYRDVRHLIWGRADCVVHLDYPARVICARLVARFLAKRRGTSAARTGEGALDSTPGNASWARRMARIYKIVREQREYRRILKGPGYRQLPVIGLTSPDETRHWLESLRQ